MMSIVAENSRTSEHFRVDEHPETNPDSGEFSVDERQLERGLRGREDEGMSGAEAFVLQGRNENGQPVAVKIFRPSDTSFAGRGRLRRSFEHAALIHIGLQPHPYILQAYTLVNLTRRDGAIHPALITEWVDGPMCEYFSYVKLRERDMPLEHILQIIEQIASALDHIHSQGIVHRDVNPANIMLKGYRRDVRKVHAVLTDFGSCAKFPISDTRPYKYNEVFAAPEITDNRNDRVGPQSDVYSLGLVAFELITGVCDPSQIDELTKEFYTLAPVLRRATNVIAKHRYPSCGLFALALREALTPFLID